MSDTPPEEGATAAEWLDWTWPRWTWGPFDPSKPRPRFASPPLPSPVEEGD